tara:strand:+ start:86 stop:226 length:141 start_codon:yes stop_codon:yes gene_type:complete
MILQLQKLTNKVEATTALTNTRGMDNKFKAYSIIILVVFILFILVY